MTAISSHMMVSCIVFMIVLTLAAVICGHVLDMCLFSAHTVTSNASFWSSHSNSPEVIEDLLDDPCVFLCLLCIHWIQTEIGTILQVIWYYHHVFIFVAISLFWNPGLTQLQQSCSYETKLRMTSSHQNPPYIASAPVWAPLDRHNLTVPANQDAGFRDNVHILCLRGGICVQDQSNLCQPLHCCIINFNLGGLKHMQTPGS